MHVKISKLCDVCRVETARCQYYPKGRSRQHDKCLNCDRKDTRNAQAGQSADPRYCIECNRNHHLSPN